jgi:hypothetical protein
MVSAHSAVVSLCFTTFSKLSLLHPLPIVSNNGNEGSLWVLNIVPLAGHALGLAVNSWVGVLGASRGNNGLNCL